MDNQLKTEYWEPTNVVTLQAAEYKQRFALIVLNQALELPLDVYAQLFSNATYKVAADGGANQLYDILKESQSSLDIELDAVIGDLDSLLPSPRAYWSRKGVPIMHDPDQYSTDFTKAVRHVREADQRAFDIVALGGLGGRVDQGLSVLHHLYMFQQEPGYPTGKVYLLSTISLTFVLQTGRHSIKVKGPGLGSNIGIIPLKEPSRITTHGLEWDVEDWETMFGGQISTSNHVKDDVVVIETTKDVLFTIDLELPQKDPESGK